VSGSFVPVTVSFIGVGNFEKTKQKQNKNKKQNKTKQKMF